MSAITATAMSEDIREAMTILHEEGKTLDFIISLL